MEKNMEHEMETGFMWLAFLRVPTWKVMET